MTDGAMARPMADDGEKGAGQSAWRRFVPALVVLAGLAAGYALGLHHYLSIEFLAESRDRLVAFRDAHPILSPIAFAVTYAVAVAFSFPAASILTVFGGFLFGWQLSTLLVAFAATLGATALFLVARSALGDTLRAKIGDRGERFARGFEENAFSYLLALRLAPVFPFFVVNIAPAFFKVPLRTYVAATFLGILPGVVAYSWLGQGVDSVITAAGRAGHEVRLSDLVTPEITIAFAVLALVAVVPPIVRTLRGRG